MIPDFVVTGPMYKNHGSGGYLCAGFWGNAWQAERELTSCAYCIA